MKSGAKIAISVLLTALLVGGLAAITRGFEDWHPDFWGGSDSESGQSAITEPADMPDDGKPRKINFSECDVQPIGVSGGSYGVCRLSDGYGSWYASSGLKGDPYDTANGFFTLGWYYSTPGWEGLDHAASVAEAMGYPDGGIVSGRRGASFMVMEYPIELDGQLSASFVVEVNSAHGMVPQVTAAVIASSDGESWHLASSAVVGGGASDEVSTIACISGETEADSGKAYFGICLVSEGVEMTARVHSAEFRRSAS